MLKQTFQQQSKRRASLSEMEKRVKQMHTRSMSIVSATSDPLLEKLQASGHDENSAANGSSTTNGLPESVGRDKHQQRRTSSLDTLSDVQEALNSMMEPSTPLGLASMAHDAIGTYSRHLPTTPMRLAFGQPEPPCLQPELPCLPCLAAMHYVSASLMYWFCLPFACCAYSLLSFLHQTRRLGSRLRLPCPA